MTTTSRCLAIANIGHRFGLASLGRIRSWLSRCSALGSRHPLRNFTPPLPLLGVARDVVVGHVAGVAAILIPRSKVSVSGNDWIPLNATKEGLGYICTPPNRGLGGREGWRHARRRARRRARRCARRRAHCRARRRAHPAQERSHPEAS